MNPKVYIETSVISYLTARLSSDLIVAAHQKLTDDWWETRRFDFELYTSELVFEEARRGDPQAAQKRIMVLQNISLLSLNQETFELADLIVARQALSEEAHADAVHISVAIIFEMDYLLSWNCRHIANAEIQKKIAQIIHHEGYNMPILCTPEVLLGG
jgi:hypothetical protein